MAKAKAKKKNDDKLVNILIAIGIICLTGLAAFNLGIVGNFIRYLMLLLFGDVFIAPMICIILICLFSIFSSVKTKLTPKKISGYIMLNVAIILFFSIPFGNSEAAVGFDSIMAYFKEIPTITGGYFDNVNVEFDGGIIGVLLYAVSSTLFAKEGSIVLAILLFVGAMLLLISIQTYQKMYHVSSRKVANMKEQNEIKKAERKLQEIKDAEEELKNIEKEKALVKQEAYASIGENKPSTNSNKSSGVFIDVHKVAVDTVSSEVNEVENIEEVTVNNNTNKEIKVVTKNYDFKTYKLPNTSLLDPRSTVSKSGANEASAKIKGAKLIEILGNFGINSNLIATHIGPSVTKFELKPDSSVKVSKINNIQDNIKMELAAKDIRIEAPISGRNAVGVEIPNVESIAVKMKDIFDKIPANKVNNKLLLVLGKDLLGEPVYCELNKMPHLLIAGATGSGKSVCMNSIIMSILLRTKPDEVKLLLIDPKKVEFTPYHQIPHLMGPVISDANEASNALKVVVNMMDERFDLFAKAGVRNIEAYNEKRKDYPEENLKVMPYVVVIIDELADLMAIAGKDVEMSIQRITQLARASGIHLIVATQRPSTDVITGIIKSNIPSRIAFSVASGIDSRTILDSIGAERLLGNGDMLYLPIGEPGAIRCQGVYVTDNEVKRVTDFVKTQGLPFYEDAFIRLEGITSNEDTAVMSSSEDPLYDEIKSYIIEQQKASTSLIQRRFGIGYNRAARMIDLLEERGIIGPVNGSKPRDVYIKKEDSNI